jgi:hypothetical protein
LSVSKAAAVEKLKASIKTTKHTIKKFNNNSKFTPVITTLDEDMIAYLLFVINPTVTNKYEKKPDITPIIKTLYSISQRATLGPQIKFNQNK